MNTLIRENRSTSNGNRQATEQFVAPPATVLESADGYTLEVEMPGVSRENLEMWVENNELTIAGRRAIPAVEGTLIHRESRSTHRRPLLYGIFHQLSRRSPLARPCLLASDTGGQAARATRL